MFQAGSGGSDVTPRTEQERLEHNLIQRVNLADALRRNASLYPNRIVLTDPQGDTTYRHLHEDANRLASSLLAAGVERGTFVGLLFRNCADYFRAYFACARIGAIALPLNPTLKLAEFCHIANETNPTVLIAQGDYRDVAGDLCQLIPSLTYLVLANSADGGQPRLPAGTTFTSQRFADLLTGDGREVEVYVEDRDALQCIYTSGTTASPKGVITSHVGAIFTALTVAHHVRIYDGDVGLVVLPIHHVGGLNDTTLPHIVAGATVVLLDGWNAVKVAEALEKYAVTDTALTAPMWIELINLNSDHRYDWTAIKTALFSIATLPPERSAQLRALCPSAAVILCSGQTEFTGFQECQRPEHQHSKPLAWGDPTLMTDIEIMDEAGQLLAPNQVGEIVYRGPQAMTEYHAHDALTAESFKFGWFHSGDLGYLDEDHTVFFVDRKKDMIKTGGENVASIDVTHVILAIDGVADCAVVGLPHERWTEAVTAFVQLSAGASLTPEDVVAFCKDRLAGYKVPKQVLFVDDFPRTASGKIQKVKLREQFADLYSVKGAKA
ncbi:MAG: AMP-dependent synthetase [Bradyrhizobium sp.]|nr:AMP-dependent synthetase [Bradyrhizobium sp.]